VRRRSGGGSGRNLPNDKQVRDFTAAFDGAPAWLPNGRECDLGGPGEEWVVLHVGDVTYVVHPGWRGCPVVSAGDKVVELTPARVESWATGGIPAVVYGPTGGMGVMFASLLDPQGSCSRGEVSTLSGRPGA